MTKPILTILFTLVLLCNIVSGQCSVTNPFQGVTIQNSNFLCGSTLDGFTGKLPSAISPEDQQPEDLCAGSAGGGGQPDNILWYSFIATSFEFDIDIFYFNCNGTPGQTIQVGVYGDTMFNEKVACNSFPTASPANLATNSAEIGKVYYLYIDGFNGATCDFTIRVNSGISTTPYIYDVKDGISGISAVEDGVLIQDFANVCAGNGELYNYQAPICEASAGALNLDNFSDLELFCYEWTIDPPGSGVIVGEQDSREVVIDWQIPGDYTLSVEITPLPELSACSPDICNTASDIMVSSRMTSTETRDTIFFCAQDLPTFCGQEVTETITMQCIDDNANCIEVLQPFKLMENDTIDYGTFVNCGNNGCFTLFGIDYCTNGSYVRPDIDDCNVFHKFVVEGFFVDIDLPLTMEMGCGIGSLTLMPVVNTNYTGTIEYQWLEGNTQVGTGLDFDIMGTGEFTFIVVFPDLDIGCSGIHTIEITESTDAPAYGLTIPTLNCVNSVGMVQFSEIDAISSIQWEGPNGFVNSNFSFTLNQGGDFKLTVFGANGCQSDTTFSVLENFDQPELDLSVDDLNCIIRTTNASFTSNMDIASVTWLSPGNVSTTLDSLSINAPGSYELTVVGENGCSTVQPFTITENVDMPTVDAGADQVWQCNTKSLMIVGSTSAGPVDLSWSFVEKGDILTDDTQPNVEVGSEGTYILNALNFESGCESSDSMTIFRNENVPDMMDFAKVDPSCFDTSDGMIQVVNVNGGSEPYRFFLNGVQAEEDFMENLTAGLYSLMVLDDFDCQLIVDVDVEEQPEISLEQMPSRVTIGYNEQFTFFALHNLDNGDVQSINWFDEAGNLIGEADTLLFQTDQSTSISIEVTNQNGCSTIRSIPIEVDFDLPIFAPNVFSPNEDGVNDFFTLFKRDDYPSKILSLAIHNRWGEQVFFKQNLEFDDESNGWDGRRDGQLLQNAVFTYVAVVELLDGGEKLVKGEVTLVR